MYNFKGFTQKANDALNGAIKVASELGHTYVGTEHLLLELTQDKEGFASTILSQSGVKETDLRNAIEHTIGVGSKSVLSIEDFTPRLKRVMYILLTELVTTLLAQNIYYLQFYLITTVTQ